MGKKVTNQYYIFLDMVFTRFNNVFYSFIIFNCEIRTAYTNKLRGPYAA
jgi:hypothetical protein